MSVKKKLFTRSFVREVGLELFFIWSGSHISFISFKLGRNCITWQRFSFTFLAFTMNHIARLAIQWLTTSHLRARHDTLLVVSLIDTSLKPPLWPLSSHKSRAKYSRVDSIQFDSSSSSIFINTSRLARLNISTLNEWLSTINRSIYFELVCLNLWSLFLNQIFSNRENNLFWMKNSILVFSSKL